MPRKTIGTNPFDGMIPTSTASEPVEEKPSKVQKDRLTIHLPINLIERIKNCVYWTPGTTLASLAEESLTETIDKIESERGKPFSHRSSELRGGRPIK